MFNSRKIVNFLIENFLSDFKKQFNEHPVPYIQDLRSLSIAWLCTYCGELVSKNNCKSIINFVDKVLDSEDYVTVGWSRIPALLSASYIITKKIHYLKILQRDITCGQSMNRLFVIESLSLISPDINFDEDFKSYVEYNIKHNNSFADECIILLLSSKGSLSQKKKWVKSQIKLYENNNSLDLLKELDQGKFVRRYHFKEIFSDIQEYILFNIFTYPKKIKGQYTLFKGKPISLVWKKNSIYSHSLNKIEFKI